MTFVEFWMTFAHLVPMTNTPNLKSFKGLGSDCHTSRTWTLSRPMNHFSIFFSRTFLRRFPRLSPPLVTLKHLVFPLTLSSQATEAATVVVPMFLHQKPTRAFTKCERDLTNKKIKVLDLWGHAEFQEQWDSYRACYCFSTADPFWQLLHHFIPETKEPSSSLKL